MRVRTLGMVMIGLVACGWTAQAESVRVVGVITGITGQGHTPSMIVRVQGNETREIATTAQTTYMKWITHKPWQQDNRATSGSLQAGRCVEVSTDGSTAKAVRVSDEPATSVFDPCKTAR